MMLPTNEIIQNDELAMTVARVLAVANQTVSAHGMKLAQLLVTISQEAPPAEHVWRVQYGPRQFINRRGGDVIILIDSRDGEVKQVIRGQ